MRHLDLFSGIGGFALAARWMGWETVGFCEREPFCQAVLRKHWPEAPIHDDITTMDAAGYAGRVDVVTAGFPCIDISSAGAKDGIYGADSGLWQHAARIIGDVRPRYIVMENVADLLYRGLGDVLGRLAALGYDAEWHCIPACYAGAPPAARPLLGYCLSCWSHTTHTACWAQTRLLTMHFRERPSKASRREVTSFFRKAH